MSFIHALAAHGRGGLEGVQISQRDWSPWVAHFTSYTSMEFVRSAITLQASPTDVTQMLSEADEHSAAIAEAIAESAELRASSPSSKDGIPPCVCFSECSLPGLLGHCERYGRFGWAFRKASLFGFGARPCVYVAPDEYAEVAKIGRGLDVSDPRGRLFALSNVYRPPGHGQVQDFTHEREWRLFAAVDLRESPPDALIAPRKYVPQMRSWFPGVENVLAVELLHEWGV